MKNEPILKETWDIWYFISKKYRAKCQVLLINHLRSFALLHFLARVNHYSQKGTWNAIKSIFQPYWGSLNNIGLLRPQFAFFCKHWVGVKLLLFGNIVNVTMTIRPWFSIVTYEFYFTICYRNVFLRLVTLVHRYTVWGVSNSSNIKIFFSNCHNKPFLRLTLVA